MFCPLLLYYQRLTLLMPVVWAIKNDPEFLRKSLIIYVLQNGAKGQT